MIVDSDTVTWIGTGASVFGGGIAIWQAARATRAATLADKARKAIIGSYEHVSLGALDGVLSGACKAMEKYGPGSRVASLKGTSPDIDAEAVRAFTATFDRNQGVLVKAFGESCTDVRNRINALLDEFAAAATTDDRLPKGKAIYLEITIFSGNMKKALDARTFDTDVRD